MIAPAFHLACGRFTGLSLTAIQLVLITRLPQGTPGILFLHMGIMNAMATAMDMGTGQALLRLCADDAGGDRLSPHSEILIRTAIRLRSRIALVMAHIHMFLILGLGDHSTLWMPSAVFLLGLQSLGVTQTRFILQAKTSPLVGTRLAGTTFSLITTAILFFSGITAPGPYLFCYALGSGLTSIWLWRLSGLSLRGKRESPGILLPQSIPLGLGTLVRSLYYHGDALLVRFLAGPAALDLYTVCYRFFSAATLLPDAMGELLLAPLTRGKTKGKSLPPNPTWQTLTSLGMIPLAVGFYFAAPLLGFCCGENYRPGAPTLRLLLVAALLVHPAALQITAALAAGKLKAILRLSLGGLVITVALCLVLVPTLGAAGAAWATLATETTILVGAAIINLRMKKGRQP